MSSREALILFLLRAAVLACCLAQGFIEELALAQHVRHGGAILFMLRGSSGGTQALSEVLPGVAEKKVGRGGFMVLRPDSGNPVEAVLEALRAAEKVFGVDINSKGYKAGALLLVHLNSTSSANLVSSFSQGRRKDAALTRAAVCPALCTSCRLLAPDAWTLNLQLSDVDPSLSW